MKILVTLLASCFLCQSSMAQIQKGVFRTPAGNTTYHQFTRTGGGAAVYVNQTDAINPILRLASKTATAGAGLVFTVQNDGSVGIGTMAPKEKLAVNGNIVAREVKVTANAADWPDYVFDSSYQLMPLPVLERQIAADGHLPGFPDAKEVAQSGIVLGKFSKLLTEKVEELTLHAIAQQKLVDRQASLLKQQAKLLQQYAKRLHELETKVEVRNNKGAISPNPYNQTKAVK